MSQKVEVILDARDAGTVRAWMAARDSVNAYEKSLEKIGPTEKRNTQEAANYERMARRVYESTLTPQEKYNRQLSELGGLLKANKISQEVYNRAVAKAKVDHEQTGVSGVKSLTSIAGAIGGVVAGYASIASAVQVWTNANERAMTQAEEVANKYDRMFRKFQVQAGLDDLQAAGAQENILDVAEKYGVTEEFAQKTATQLVSSGFSADDAQKEALDFSMKLFSTSNLKDMDPTQLTQALGQFLAAQGLDKNAANLRKIGIGTQRLFKGTDMQVSDLSNLAGKSQAFAGRISPEELLGTFDVLREKTSPDVASTTLQSIGTRLMTAKGDVGREAALRQLKLKPEDVDLLGENMSTVLDRLGTGLETVDEADRFSLMKSLFDESAAGPMLGLIRDRAKLPAATALMADEAGFAADVGTSTSGRANAKERLELRQRRQQAADDQMGDLSKLALDNVLRERGAMPIERDVRAGIFDKASYLTGSRAIGQRAATTSIGDAVSGGLGLTSVSGAIGFGLQAATGGLGRGENAAVNDRLIEVLQRNTDALEKNTKATDQNSGGERVPSMPNVMPPPPVPAARLGDSAR